MRRRLSATGSGLIFIAVLALVVVAVPRARGQAPPVVEIPSSVTLAPGEGVSFSHRPCAGLTPTTLGVPGGTPVMCPEPATHLNVTYLRTQLSAGNVTVSHDGGVLVLASLAGVRIQVLPPDAAACAADDEQQSVLRCRIGPSIFRTNPVRFTTLAQSEQTEEVPLSEGCNSVVLTWPAGTDPVEVAAAVSPTAALVAVWRFDNAAQRYQGYISVLRAPNDLLTVSRGDPAFICMTSAGSLTRPAP